jgi:hypothetical protein
MSVRSSQRLPLRRRHALRGIALLLGLGALAGCSGGGGGVGSIGFSCSDVGELQVLCLSNCNLGCSSTGCAQSNIAQNQTVIFQFSEAVDPGTVSPSSIRFRTASGDQPVGEFFVNGNQVEFVPTLAISGGQTFFGFAAGETYTLTIPGGEQAAVLRGTSGKPFGRTLTCSLAATLGIVDVNGTAPRATMVVPTASQLTSAPRNTDIVLEFNEMIDATPFLAGAQSPVTFSVRRNRAAIGGGFECNPSSNAQPLGGAQSLSFDAGRGISILSFRPVQELQGNVCIEVNITDQVADLSGRPAQPQTLTFLTEVVPLVEQRRTENFQGPTMLDAENSAASWGGGTATFFPIGGDGSHGAFSLALAEDMQQTVDGKRLFTMDTDNTVIPPSNTTTGAALAVTDGRYFFTSMVVPSDVRLRFVGSKPPQITVAGQIDVLGHIDVAGFAPPVVGGLTIPPSTGMAAAGQPGGIPGAGGGAGGRGGDKVTAQQAQFGGAGPNTNGSDGEDAAVLAGHGYATSAIGTRGRGSPRFPASGLNANLIYGTSSGVNYSPSATAGGGGGGFLQPGANGVVTSNNHPDPGLAGVTATSAGTDTITVAGATWLPNRYQGRQLTTGASTGTQVRSIVANTSDTITVATAWSQPPAPGTFTVGNGTAPNRDAMGPSAAGGSALQLFPFPAPSGLQRASAHFLVTGAGGAGAGSHGCLGLALLPTGTANDRWSPGCGGGGGAGAMSLRAGNQLRVGAAARLLANGGRAYDNTLATNSMAAPGGGGSGGSIVLQSGNVLDITGNLIDVRGGLGGIFNRSLGGNPAGTPPNGANVQIAGGNGANGFVRLEAPALPPLTALAAMQPAATADNVGVLNERDLLVMCASKHYSTGLAFGPEYARYEIRGTIDGVPFVLSDDPAISLQAAGEGAPVRALWQSAQLDLATLAVQQAGPWRAAVRSGLGQDGIDADALNGFRFRLYADFNLGAAIVVDEVVVVFRS